MPGWLYESGDNGIWVFVLLTVLLGGAAAFVSGKSIAETWRPSWQIPVYMFALALVVRFLHYALFEEVLVSGRNFLVDYVVLAALAVVGFRMARARQMETQYGDVGR